MLKSDNANQRQFSARVRQHSIRKFHKAILWAEQLSALCKVHCDQRTQREAEPQTDALTMVRVATTAFLDAYLKGDQGARDFLAENRLGEVTRGFSRLEAR